MYIGFGSEGGEKDMSGRKTLDLLLNLPELQLIVVICE